MPWLETRVPPPVILLISGGLMFLIDRATPALAVPASLRTALGALLLTCGLAVTVAGVMAFRRRRTTLNPLRPDEASALVTDGIFRHTRNPMYLGMLLMLCGWAAYLANPASLLGPLLFVTYITRFQILPEERVLRASFQERSDAYFSATPRWL